MEHSPIGASVIERVWHCPGSVGLIEKAPPAKTSVYAEEGTKAHRIAYRALMEVFAQPELKSDVVKTASIEMLEATAQYVAFVSELVYEWQVKPQLEKRVVIDEELKLWGTADCILVVPYNRLIVIDFKYGAGVKVSAWENKQLMYYALGALLALTREEQEEIPIVEMIIVQPRIYGEDIIERFEMATSDLLKWEKELLEHAIATKDDEALLNPGDWCKFCPAAVICPALEAYASQLTSIAFDSVKEQQPPAVATMHTAYIAQVLDKADMVRDWLKSVEAYALDFLQKGNEIAGYTLKEKFGNRKWANAEDLAIALEKAGYMMTKTHDVKLKSPAQLEKVVKDIDLKPYITCEFNGYALVKGDAKLEDKAFAAVATAKEIEI